MGCHAQQPEAGEEETDYTGIVQDAMTEPEEPDAADAEQEETDATDAEQAEDPSENSARRDPKNAKLLCLESGDMETLL